MYLTDVVPSQWAAFRSKVSVDNTAKSKLHSLRQAVANENRDTPAQKRGFKLDVFFNTTYVGILYTLNILMVFNTAATIDIVLNALAIDFISKLDEVRAEKRNTSAGEIASEVCRRTTPEE